MKKILIVSPHFPPVNAPDMQRVRLALPHLRANGWEPTVLAVTPESVEGAVIERPLLDTFPADIRVIRVAGLPARLTRRIGVGSLWWRCRRALVLAGDRLLAAEKFDVVFFSTTQFGAFSLGPRWRQRFSVPYVLDYQDPWISDYYARSGTRPPGGRLKFAVSQWSARHLEPRALRDAAAVIAASPSYGEELTRRYTWFDQQRVTVLPFGASAADFNKSAEHRPDQPLVDFRDGNFHHVYVGRGGVDMALAMRILFRAFRLYQQAEPGAASRMRFHFIGTDYSPPPRGKDWALPIAEAEGVAAQVTEHRERVPYFDALYYLQSADAVIAIGSDDPAYSPSKIFPCILARRPMLVILHRDSPAMTFATDVSAGLRFGFIRASDVDSLALDVQRGWFTAGAMSGPATFDETRFARFSAAALTERLAKVFDDVAKIPRERDEIRIR